MTVKELRRSAEARDRELDATAKLLASLAERLDVLLKASDSKLSQQQ
jgi:hypothetical protein